MTALNTDCLQYRLTETERRAFEERGYFAVENVLSAEQIAQAETIMDGVYRQKLAEGHSDKEALFYPNFIPDDAFFANLVDYEKILPKVWGILGWNIYLYHAHLIITPPTGREKDNKTFGWHQDSGRTNKELEGSPRPRLSLKVAYFISDTSVPDRGNFWVVPGSHMENSLNRSTTGVGQPPGAVPVLAKPGTAVFFDRRLWHTATPNWSNITRKVLFYGYGYRWIRTKDDMTVQDLWETSDPIRRQLLGWGSNANSYYSPSDNDVPLKGWLEAHCPEDVFETVPG